MSTRFTMQTFTWIFLLFLVASTLTQLYLSLRQRNYVAAHRQLYRLLLAIKSHWLNIKRLLITPLPRATRAARLGIGLLILLGWTLGGGFNALDQFWRSLAGVNYSQA